LTQIPFDIPYADEHGNVFELEAVAKFVKQFKKNPGKTSSEAYTFMQINGSMALQLQERH